MLLFDNAVARVVLSKLLSKIVFNIGVACPERNGKTKYWLCVNRCYHQRLQSIMTINYILRTSSSYASNLTIVDYEEKHNQATCK